MDRFCGFPNNEAMLQSFKNYYFASFGGDLKKWFDIENHFADIKVPFIGFATNAHQPADFKIVSQNDFFFSVACFYTFLIPQAVALTVNNKDAFYNFSKCSGWPICSCGLGGFMSAPQIVFEAHLKPEVEDECAYNDLLKGVLDFFQNEVRDFLTGNAQNLNAEAYATLCQMTKGKVDEICKLIATSVNEYIEGRGEGYMLPNTSEFWN